MFWARFIRDYFSMPIIWNFFFRTIYWRQFSTSINSRKSFQADLFRKKILPVDQFWTDFAETILKRSRQFFQDNLFETISSGRDRIFWVIEKIICENFPDTIICNWTQFSSLALQFPIPSCTIQSMKTDEEEWFRYSNKIRMTDQLLKKNKNKNKILMH